MKFLVKVLLILIQVNRLALLVVKMFSFYSKFSFKIVDCVDLMDEGFCEKALLSDFCDEKIYWNGKLISEWCKKMCKIC